MRGRRMAAAGAVALAALGIGTPVAAAAGGHAATRSAGSASYRDTDTAAQRRAEAVAFARRIVRHRPAVAGERPEKKAVPRKLRKPDERTAVGGLVNRRGGYATAAASPRRLLHHYAHLRIAGYRLTEESVTPRHYHPLGAWTDSVVFERTNPPATMVSGELHVDFKGRPHRRTLIGTFGQVVPHPAWHDSERIPVEGATARVIATRYSAMDQMVGRRHATVDAATAQALSSVFDNSFISPPAECAPGIPGRHTEYDVRIQSAGQRWLVHLPDLCDSKAADVTQNGKGADGVDVRPAFRRLARQAVAPTCASVTRRSSYDGLVAAFRRDRVAGSDARPCLTHRAAAAYCRHHCTQKMLASPGPICLYRCGHFQVTRIAAPQWDRRGRHTAQLRLAVTLTRSDGRTHDSNEALTLRRSHDRVRIIRAASSS